MLKRFVFLSLAILVITLIASIIALLNSLTLPENPGQFLSALIALAGILVATTALYSQIITEDIRRKSSDEIWKAKQRLEEALHMYIVMLITELKTTGPKIFDANNPVPKQALKNLSEALKQSRDIGLYRALVGISTSRGTEFNVGYEMAVLEAYVNHDLQAGRKAVGQAVIVLIPDLLQALQQVTYEDVKWVSYELPQEPIDKLKKALGQSLEI